jgi:hypothetical protein
VRTPQYVGILSALRDDMKAGWMQSVAELLHADTFDKLIDQSRELLDKNYKDAAAVIVGSTLESHLRLLADSTGVGATSGGKPKKADLINAELAKADVYTTLQQKAVFSWGVVHVDKRPVATRTSPGVSLRHLRPILAGGA